MFPFRNLTATPAMKTAGMPKATTGTKSALLHSLHSVPLSYAPSVHCAQVTLLLSRNGAHVPGSPPGQCSASWQ
eukprot:5495846-Amphidinium_carterae.1